MGQQSQNEQELLIMATAEIVKKLISAVENNKSVDLRKVIFKFFILSQ